MNASLLRRLFALEFKRAVTYRASFWLGFLGNVLSQFAVAYFLWSAMFKATGATSMKGFSLPDLTLYFLLVPLIERVAMGPRMGQISSEIYDGTLNRFLVYPVSFFFFKYVTSLAQSLLFACQMSVMVLLYFVFFDLPPAFHITLSGLALAAAALLMSTVLYFILAACFEMFAFWVDNVWSLMVLLGVVLQFLGGGLIPLNFFPPALRTSLELTPFPYMISFPIQFLMKDIGPSQAVHGFAVMAGWIVALSALVSWMWSRGTRRYTGVGI